jgi:hypothetical protein
VRIHARGHRCLGHFRVGGAPSRLALKAAARPALHTQDILYRLLDIAGELSEHKTIIMGGHGEHACGGAETEQLRAGIAATGERLSGCQALMAVDAVADTSGSLGISAVA